MERATRADRLVETRPIRGPWTYLTALHEFAHIIHRGAQHPMFEPDRRSHTEKQRILEMEAAAWQWAFANAKVPIPYWVFGRVSDLLQQWKGWTGMY